MVERAILDKVVYSKFIEIIKAQGGYIRNEYLEGIDESIDIPVICKSATYMKEVKADKDGYLNILNAEKIGTALVELGGGRHKKTDDIDYSVGFKFAKKVGDKVQKGDTIVYVYFNDKDKFKKSMEELLPVIKLHSIKPVVKLHIIEIIS
jgi:pyrimidine-nucleoside phosphorylase